MLTTEIHWVCNIFQEGAASSARGLAVLLST